MLRQQEATETGKNFNAQKIIEEAEVFHRKLQRS